MAMAMSVSAVGVVPAIASEGASGTFSGTAEGFHGEVKVTLTLENGEITDCVIEGEGETPNIGGAAMEKMQAEIIENKTVLVDSVSGASYTSSGVLAAIEAAVAEAGMAMTDFAEIEQAEAQTIEKETTLCILGAGGAGLTCAASALDNGLTDIIVLEKMSFAGGATSNAGGIDAGMSKLQAELEMEGDSVELIHDDIMRSGTDHDEELVWIMANEQGATLDWLKETHEIPFNDRYGSDFPEHTVQRFFVCDGGMSNAMSMLAQQIADNGADVMYETRAEEFIMDGDKVVGVKATDSKGNTVIVKADAVVVATGGYGSNQELISKNPGHLQYAVFYGVHSSEGDGQLMGEAIGAKMLNMGYAKMYPNGISQPGTNDGKATPMPSLTTTSNTGSFFVNKEGKRFVNENLPFADIKEATCLQPDEIMYLVMDQDGWDTWSGMVSTNSSAAGNISLETMEEYFESDDTQPTFTRGTLAEAAEKAGIDAEGLAATLAEWNATVEAGEDTAFGRTALIPFNEETTVYIVEQRLRFATTLGGFDITSNFECQKEDGTIIEGLYAVGECVGGPNGTEAIPGSMAAWAVTSGRVCGEYLSTILGK